MQLPGMHRLRQWQLRKLKSHSYVAHLGAPNYLRVFTQLQKLEVLTSDKMTRTVTIKQCGKTETVPTATAFFHLDVTDMHLKLCVPENPERQQVCLSRHLPIGLLQHFGASAQNRGVELGSIITAKSLFVVDTILDEDGVIEIEGVCRPEAAESAATISTPNTEQEIGTATNTMHLAVLGANLHQIQRPALDDESFLVQSQSRI